MAIVEIPCFLRQKILDAPELSYGVVAVTVILKSGARIKNVEVAWGHQVIKCRGEIEIPFSGEEIIDVEIEDPRIRQKSGDSNTS